MKNSCYNCLKRFPGCHAKCESYKAFQKLNQEILDQKKQDYEARRTTPHIKGIGHKPTQTQRRNAQFNQGGRSLCR